MRCEQSLKAKRLPMSDPILVEVLRGNLVESYHRAAG